MGYLYWISGLSVSQGYSQMAPFLERVSWQSLRYSHQQQDMHHWKNTVPPLTGGKIPNVRWIPPAARIIRDPFSSVSDHPHGLRWWETKISKSALWLEVLSLIPRGLRRTADAIATFLCLTCMQWICTPYAKREKLAAPGSPGDWGIRFQ